MHAGGGDALHERAGKDWQRVLSELCLSTGQTQCLAAFRASISHICPLICTRLHHRTCNGC